METLHFKKNLGDIMLSIINVSLIKKHEGAKINLKFYEKFTNTHVYQSNFCFVIIYWLLIAM